MRRGHGAIIEYAPDVVDFVKEEIDAKLSSFSNKVAATLFWFFLSGWQETLVLYF
jgi:hypothetical protein